MSMQPINPVILAVASSQPILTRTEPALTTLEAECTPWNGQALRSVFGISQLEACHLISVVEIPILPPGLFQPRTLPAIVTSIVFLVIIRLYVTSFRARFSSVRQELEKRNFLTIVREQVFDITFCGDWAGDVWSSSSCASLSSSCNAYVQDNPSAFADTYWIINSLQVYQQSAPSGGTVSYFPFPLTSIFLSVPMFLYFVNRLAN